MDATRRAELRQRYLDVVQVPVFALGVLFLVGLIEVVSGGGDTKTGRVLIAIAWIGFAIDIVVQWVLDPDPRTFPRRHLFGIVAVLLPAFRALLAFYVVVRLAVHRRRLESRVQLYAAYLTVLIVLFGAVLVLAAERDYPGSNIHTYGESLWWAFVTVTTVGYGDYVPVSPLGRTLALLMLANGVVVISVITATIASRFVSAPDKGEKPVKLDDLDERLARIEAALASLGATFPPATDPAPDTPDDEPTGDGI